MRSRSRSSCSASARRCSSASRWHRRRCRRLESLPDHLEHLLPTPFLDRLQAAEVEAGELDAADRAHRAKPEVGKEVSWEHCAMDEETLRGGSALPIAVRERLERTRALVPRLPDRGEEKRLLHPGLRVRLQVGTRDEDRVRRGWACRQIRGTRKEMCRPILHGAEHAAVVVAVDRPPGPPLVLGMLDPLTFVGLTVATGLPPNARLTDRGSGLERGARETGDAGRHLADRTTSSVTSGRAKRRNGTNVVPMPGETWRA